MIPTDQVDAIRKALGDAGTDHDVHVFEQADHGFNCDQRASYDKASAAEAWRRSFAMFDAKLRA